MRGLTTIVFIEGVSIGLFIGLGIGITIGGLLW